MGVVAVRSLLQRAVEVPEGAFDVAGVQRDGRGVDPFGRCLGAGWPAGGFTLADLQIEPRALDELALVRVPLNDAAEAVGGRREVVALQRADACLVDREAS